MSIATPTEEGLGQRRATGPRPGLDGATGDAEIPRAMPLGTAARPGADAPEAGR